MPARKPPAESETPQFERFIQTAQEIGASETDEALDKALDRLAPPKKSQDMNKPTHAA